MIPLTLLHVALALESSMPMKPRPKLKGAALGPTFKSKDGKVERTGNPKASVSQKIAKRRKPKNTWRKAT